MHAIEGLACCSAWNLRGSALSGSVHGVPHLASALSRRINSMQEGSLCGQLYVDLLEALRAVHRAELYVKWTPEEWTIHDEAVILTAFTTRIDTPTSEIV